MTNRMPSGRSYWVEMQERVVEFMRNVPLGSRVWIAYFNNRRTTPQLFQIDTEQERTAAIDRVRRASGPAGGTALWDTLAMAFEEAERLSRENPNRFITVMAYTDGIDRDSQKWNENSIRSRFNQLVSTNRNMWMFVTRMDREAVRFPLPIGLAPKSLGLTNPIRNPNQNAEVEFIASDPTWKILDAVGNKPVAIIFEPDAGQSIAVQVGAVGLKRGKLSVPLKVTNPAQLKPDLQYTGTLRITYPEMDKYVLRGPDTIRVGFQRGEAPSIFGVQPAEGSVYAVGKRVHFHVDTLQGARIKWDFGDGDTAIGVDVVHVYGVVGQPKVTVSVEADNTVGTVSKSIGLQIVDVGIVVAPIAGPVIEGTTVPMSCMPRGPIERLEWIIDGQSYPAVAGDPSGKTMAFSSDVPGQHRVSVIGYWGRGSVASDERTLMVLAKPALELVQPQDKATLSFAQEYIFEAQVSGPVKGVAWAVRRSDGTELVSMIRPVIASNERSVSQFAYTFGEEDNALDVTVEAKAVLPADMKFPPPVGKATARVNYPIATATIALPAPSVPFGKNVELALQSSEPFQSIAWDFGDGTTDTSNNAHPVHTYAQHGTFALKADVTFKGGRTVRVQENLTMTSMPPVATPVIRQNGKQVARVLVGSTVDLADESTGDIIERAWEHNGKSIPPSQRSLLLEQLGPQTFVLRVTGPAGRDVPAVEAKSEIVFPVVKPPETFVFVLACVGAVVAMGLTIALLTGNAPMAWKIYYSNEGPANENDHASVRVRKKWKWWRIGGKYAEFPVSSLFRDSPYWNSGDGAREAIQVTSVPSGSDLSGSLRYSGEGDQLVVADPATENGRTVDYAWRDKRCKQLPYQKLFFRLVKERHNVLPAVLISLIVATSVAAWLWWMWHRVYRSGS